MPARNPPTDQEIAQRMTGLEQGIVELTKAVDAMRGDLSDVKVGVDETRDIVKAWEAVKTGGRFVKWLGALAAAIAAIVVAIKGGIALAIK
ncbi:hypothetical protein [Novosphingobium capsulatum]|uniref:hypothetical protein n=2 Tax=Novosphingobium capsulatum TaxID=13688 RepID=UPI000787DD99|nr:hypothetical protein [Novosphingobium capsulatum]